MAANDSLQFNFGSFARVFENSVPADEFVQSHQYCHEAAIYDWRRGLACFGPRMAGPAGSESNGLA